MLLAESRHGARQDKRGDGRDRADSQEAALGGIAHGPLGLADRGENGLRTAEEFVPGVGEDDLAARVGRRAAGRRRAVLPSSRRICSLRVGCVTPSRSAARVKLPVSATATKYRSWCSSITKSR